MVMAAQRKLEERNGIPIKAAQNNAIRTHYIKARIDNSVSIPYI